jgi:hypothetical protein
MTGAVRRAAPALIVDLRGGDVLMAEQVLHLADIDGAVKQQRGVGRAQRVRRIDAALPRLAVLARVSFMAPGRRSR